MSASTVRAALLVATCALCAAPPAIASAEKPVLMVLYFDNQTGQARYDVLRKGLADMLVTDLVALDSVTVVEREKLESMLAELKLQQSASFDPATRARLGKLVGARFQLAGSIVALEPLVSLEARLFDVAKGEVKVTARAAGSPEKLFELEQALVRQLATGIAGKIGPEAFAKTRDASLDSLLAYSQAVDRADQGDSKGATRALAGLVAAAPNFTLAKDRYLALLERLRHASERREGVLTAQETELWKKAEAILARGVPHDAQGQASRLGYRILRGQLVLQRISRLGQRPEQHCQVQIVPSSQAPQLKAALIELAENWRALIDELSHVPAREIEGRLEHEDADLAEKLGLEAHYLLGRFRYDDAREMLARMILFGDQPTTLPFPRVRPSLVELAPEWAARAQELLAAARAQPWEHDSKSPRFDNEIAAYDLSADWALKQGNTEQAVGLWQEMLERHPTHARFSAIKEKVEFALETGPMFSALVESEKHCDTTTSSALMLLAERLRRTQLGKVLSMGQRIAKRCGAPGLKHASWLPVAALQVPGDVAMRDGDCPAFKRALEAVSKVSEESAHGLSTGPGRVCLQP